MYRRIHIIKIYDKTICIHTRTLYALFPATYSNSKLEMLRKKKKFKNLSHIIIICFFTRTDEILLPSIFTSPVAFVIDTYCVISRHSIRTQLSCSSLRSINISCNSGPCPLVKSATSFLTCSCCFSFNIGFSVSK